MKKLFLIPVVMTLFALQSFGYTATNNHYENNYARQEVAANRTDNYQTGCYRHGYYVERPVVVYRGPCYEPVVRYAPHYYAPRAYVPYYRHGHYYHRGC